MSCPPSLNTRPYRKTKVPIGNHNRAQKITVPRARGREPRGLVSSYLIRCGSRSARQAVVPMGRLRRLLFSRLGLQTLQVSSAFAHRAGVELTLYAAFSSSYRFLSAAALAS